MIKFLFILAASFSINFCRANILTDPINAVIGDISFLKTYGINPTSKNGESIRIQTHLKYVEQVLRNADVAHLAKEQIQRRKHVLNLLHTYSTAGKFPSNYDFPTKRKPCFIDKNGNICAVGYLIEKTAGRSVAEEINKTHKYDYIADMNEAFIKDWAEKNGLTMRECATIQPSYGPPPEPVSQEMNIEKSYGISSGLLGGVNMAFSALNLSGKLNNNKVLPYIGLLTGTAEIAIGIANIKKDEISYFIDGGQISKSYKAQNNLSYLNIAMGTSTLITSAVNLYLNRKIKDKRTSVNLNSSTNYYTNKIAMGLCVVRRI